MARGALGWGWKAGKSSERSHNFVRRTSSSSSSFLRSKLKLLWLFSVLAFRLLFGTIISHLIFKKGEQIERSKRQNGVLKNLSARQRRRSAQVELKVPSSSHFSAHIKRNGDKRINVVIFLSPRSFGLKRQCSSTRPSVTSWRTEAHDTRSSSERFISRTSATTAAMRRISSARAKSTWCCQASPTRQFSDQLRWASTRTGEPIESVTSLWLLITDFLLRNFPADTTSRGRSTRTHRSRSINYSSDVRRKSTSSIIT
jgi:hypothetical protein